MNTITNHESRHSSDAKRNQTAILLLVVFSSIANQSTLQAEVPAILKERPWLHAVRDHDEWWFSTERQVEAFRLGDQLFTFLDLKANEINEYQANKEVIRRSRPRVSQKDLAYVVFELLKGNVNVEWPPSGNTIAVRTSSVVESEGKKYTQIEFSSKEISSGLVDKSIFRIDPSTNLVDQWTTVNTFGDVLRSKIDYLPAGPADIYALGAPRDAKIVNRIPSERMQQIIDQSVYNRQHLNPYSAYIFGTSNIKEMMGVIYRIKRVGMRWLVERLYSEDLQNLRSRMKNEKEIPTNEKDLMVWWKSKVESLRFAPVQLSDGKIVYNFLPHVDGATQYIWPQSSPIGSIDPHPSIGIDLESMTYHPIYAISDEAENPIEPESSIGPTGMTLITQRKSPTEVVRNWLDPTKGNSTVRHEVETNGGIRVTVAEELQQSPAGIWYATRVRDGRVNSPGEKLESSNTDKNGNVTGTSVRYYLLDFDSPIPGDVFKTTATVRYPEQVEEEMK